MSSLTRAKMPQDSGVDQVDQGEDGEDARDDPDHRALEELGDLLGHLGLGQLDLLAHQQRGALGDLLDRLAELGCRRFGHLVHQPLEDLGEDERAGERRADQDLGPVGARRRRRAAGARRRAAGQRRGRPRPRARGARRSRPPRARAGRSARPARPARAPSAPCAESFSLRSVASSDAPARPRRSPPRPAGVRGRQLAAQLGAARLGALALRLGVLVGLTRADLPRTRGGKSPRRRGW